MIHGKTTVQAIRDEDQVCARVLGPLNAETVGPVDREIRALAGERCRRLLIDLSGADYLDSDGIRWLQRVHSDLSERSLEIRLAVQERSPADRTLTLLQLDAAFVIERHPQEHSGSRDCVAAGR